MPEDHGPGRGRIDPAGDAIPGFDYRLRSSGYGYAASGQEGNDRWEPNPPSPLYKFLSAKGEAHNGGYGFVWSLPTKNPDGTWEPGEWCSVDGTLVACKNGLHLTDATHAYQWTAPRLFVAEVEGGVIDAYDKYVARRVRLVREIESWGGATTANEIQVPEKRFRAALDTFIEEKRAPARLLKLLSETIANPSESYKRRTEISKKRTIAGWKVRIETLQNNIRRTEGKLPIRHAKGHGPRATSRRLSATLHELEAINALAYPSFETIAHVELGHKWFGRSASSYGHVWGSQLWTGYNADFFSEEGRKIRGELEAKVAELREEARGKASYGDIPEELVAALGKRGYHVKVKVA